MGVSDGQTPGAFFIVIAILFDLLTFIPFVGTFVSLLAAMFFAVALSHHDVPLGSRYAGRFLFTIVGELLPFVGALPFWTLMVMSIRSSERRRRAAG
jgi:hypothetical protein